MINQFFSILNRRFLLRLWVWECFYMSELGLIFRKDINTDLVDFTLKSALLPVLLPSNAQLNTVFQWIIILALYILRVFPWLMFCVFGIVCFVSIMCVQRFWRTAALSIQHFWRVRWRQWETNTGVLSTVTSCSSTSAHCPRRIQQAVPSDMTRMQNTHRDCLCLNWEYFLT